MKYFNFKNIAINLVAATALVYSLPVFADNMDLNGINSNYMNTETVTYNNGVTNFTENVYSGGITGTLDSQATQFFFCYDLLHDINVPGNYVVNVTSPSASLPSYLGLSSTFNLQVASALLNNVNFNAFTSANQFDALQLALWSILYNWTTTSQSTTTLGTSSNVFSVSNVSSTVNSDALGFLSLAESYITNGTYATAGGNVSLMVNSSDSSGNVIQTLAGISTPEPGTYALLGSFLAMAIFCMKRNRVYT